MSCMRRSKDRRGQGPWEEEGRGVLGMNLQAACKPGSKFTACAEMLDKPRKRSKICVHRGLGREEVRIQTPPNRSRAGSLRSQGHEEELLTQGRAGRALQGA
ncbi:hypothetical protein GOP47_0026299 [Adiantum capillus-veneris]|nr:hypothetical protein GOP47_0026299 [Adiantum capillus-veneris]